MKVFFRVSNINAHPFENSYVSRVIDRVLDRLNNANMNRIPGRLHLCDPFSNNKTVRRQGTTLVTNDLNPKFNADYCMDANDFAEEMYKQQKLFDLVLFDPPYSLRQLKDCYESIGQELPHWQTQNMWGRAKDALAKCIAPGGYVISLGWSSHGFGERRGFEKQEIHNIEQSGKDGRYNIQLVVEKKVSNSILAYCSVDDD